MTSDPAEQFLPVWSFLPLRLLAVFSTLCCLLNIICKFLYRIQCLKCKYIVADCALDGSFPLQTAFDGSFLSPVFCCRLLSMAVSFCQFLVADCFRWQFRFASFWLQTAFDGSFVLPVSGCRLLSMAVSCCRLFSRCHFPVADCSVDASFLLQTVQ